MVRIFNAFQIVVSFAALPYLISWLSTADFTGSRAAFYTACVIYLAASWFMVYAVYESIENDKL
jgi:hypothetical protein